MRGKRAQKQQTFCLKETELDVQAVPKGHGSSIPNAFARATRFAGRESGAGASARQYNFVSQDISDVSWWCCPQKAFVPASTAQAVHLEGVQVAKPTEKSQFGREGRPQAGEERSTSTISSKSPDLYPDRRATFVSTQKSYLLRVLTGRMGAQISNSMQFYSFLTQNLEPKILAFKMRYVTAGMQ